MTIFKSKLKQVSQEIIKKRGRPVGSSKKPKIFKDVHPETLMDTLKKWDEMEAQPVQTDWETIAKKQEERLSAYISENEELAKICIMRWEEIQHLKYLVKYLEGRHEDTSV
jgi:sugar-specific transcriptional regulator TrmB